MPKTIEEIDALKENWSKDPCWDIETTEGFEEHKDELLAWRNDLEIKHKLARQARNELRFEHVMNATGVTNKDIALALHTWDEIESAIEYAQRQSENFDFVAAEEVRASLLVAAQLKRIADAIEEENCGDVLARILNLGAEKGEDIHE